jgi:hypothetical protein
MILHRIVEFYTEWLSVCPKITSKFEPSPHLKAWLNDIMIEMKVAGMSMTLYYTKLHLPNYSGS